MPAARKVAASGSCPGYRQRWGALRELHGGAENFLMRDRRLVQAAVTSSSPRGLRRSLIPRTERP